MTHLLLQQKLRLSQRLISLQLPLAKQLRIHQSSHLLGARFWMYIACSTILPAAADALPEPACKAHCQSATFMCPSANLQTDLANKGCAHRLILERDRAALAEADAGEWQARRAVIEKQSEEARREKQRRRAQAERDGEKARRSQVSLLSSLPAQPHLPHTRLDLHDLCSSRARVSHKMLMCSPSCSSILRGCQHASRTRQLPSTCSRTPESLQGSSYYSAER